MMTLWTQPREANIKEAATLGRTDVLAVDHQRIDPVTTGVMVEDQLESRRAAEACLDIGDWRECSGHQG